MQEKTDLSKPNSHFVFVRAALSMILLWLSFPPVGYSFLGWIALIPVFDLVIDPRTMSKNDFRKIWLVGLCYWLGTFYFIPIPHPALWAGWAVVSIYLACYLPIFVGASRALNRRVSLPHLLAIPVCWTGLEFIRCHLFTGMGLVCLSHTQYQYPQLIQVSDLSGAYTLTFAMAFIGTAIVQMRSIFAGHIFKGVAHLALGCGMAAGIYFYGNAKLQRQYESTFENLRVGFVQGSVDTVFPKTKEEAEKFYHEKTQHYEELYRSAAAQWNNVDVVLWPENGWSVPDLHPDTDTQQMEPRQLQIYNESAFYAWTNLFIVGKTTPVIIAGALTVDPLKNDSYGSALFIGEDGEVQGRYFKNHLVMFGEYVPLAEWFPLLRRIPAIGKGLVAGTESNVFEVKKVRLAPSICFESTVPHYIRDQVLKLKADDREPDILVNLTNDGWFYGTSCLDFHLACNVFRAVEMRKPMLVCANTGFSAHIDSFGNIVEQGPRRQPKTFLSEVSGVQIDSTYCDIGDWIPCCFAIITIFGFVIAIFDRKTNEIENDNRE